MQALKMAAAPMALAMIAVVMMAAAGVMNKKEYA
jgi:hypothetical protein